MKLEPHKTYIQKNPLFGRKVILIERLFESVWDWNICDVTIVSLDGEIAIERKQRVAASVFEDQGLEEIPTEIFLKIQNLAKVLNAVRSANANISNVSLSAETNEINKSLLPKTKDKTNALLSETKDKINTILIEAKVITEDTYDSAHKKMYLEQYEKYSQQQMARVTDVIDVHK